MANAVVRELANVVTSPDGGDTDLDPSDNTQLLTAIRGMIGGGSTLTIINAGAKTWKRVGADGFWEMGGFAYLGTSNEQLITLTFPVSFPSACLGVWAGSINTGSLNGDTQLQEYALYADHAVLFAQSDTHPFGDTVSYRWRAWGY